MNLDMEKMWTSTLFRCFYWKIHIFLSNPFKEKRRQKHFQNLAFHTKHPIFQPCISKAFAFESPKLLGIIWFASSSHNSWQMKVTNYMACPMSQCPWLWFKTHLVMSNKEVSQITHINKNSTWLCNAIDHWL
jgi:hypothetical protein